MRKRVQITLAVLLVGFAVMIAWQSMRLPEPVYRGRPVSYWITRSGEVYEGSDFGRIGGFGRFADSNAIPYLVKALERQDGLFSKPYLGAWLKLPSQIQRRLPTPHDAEQIRYSTAMSLGDMGAVARPAIPTLLRTLRDDKSEAVRGWAAWSLGQLGKEDGLVRGALTEALSDRSPFVRSQAVDALGLVGGAAQSAVTALVKCLDDPHRDVRLAATNVLKQIDFAAAHRAGVN